MAYRDVKETMEKYNLQDPWDVVETFEKVVAEYTGAPYAIAVDNCTNSLFLSLLYLQATGEVEIPKQTYLSVPGAIIRAGCFPKFIDLEWTGIYQLKPYPILDSAWRFTKDMYVPGTFQCLSFHAKKCLNVGRGGMILTDDQKSVEYFKLMRYEGRDCRIPHDQMPEPTLIGFNHYMEPERAARALELFEAIPEHNPDGGGSWKYKDLSQYKIFQRP